MKTWNDFLQEARRKVTPLKDEDLRETLIFVEADRMMWAHDYYDIVHRMEEKNDTEAKTAEVTCEQLRKEGD